jgi:predicted RNase H-like HicB family nuclease
MPPYLAMIRPLEDQGFVVEFPDLPGCTATEPNFQLARERARAMLPLHLMELQALGSPCPEPRTMKELLDCGLANNAIPVLIPGLDENGNRGEP